MCFPSLCIFLCVFPLFWSRLLVFSLPIPPLDIFLFYHFFSDLISIFHYLQIPPMEDNEIAATSLAAFGMGHCVDHRICAALPHPGKRYIWWFWWNPNEAHSFTIIFCIGIFYPNFYIPGYSTTTDYISPFPWISFLCCIAGIFSLISILPSYPWRRSTKLRDSHWLSLTWLDYWNFHHIRILPQRAGRACMPR